jgi:hypothetical protein
LAPKNLTQYHLNALWKQIYTFEEVWQQPVTMVTLVTYGNTWYR